MAHLEVRVRSGWIDDVIAMPWAKSVPRFFATVPRISSELLRVSSPSRGDSAGSVPLSFSLCSSFCVAERRGGENDLLGGVRFLAAAQACRSPAPSQPGSHRRRGNAPT